MLNPGRIVFMSMMALAFAACPHRQTQGADKSAAESLDSFTTLGIDEWSVTGLAVAVVKDGQVVFLRGYGVRDKRTGKPVDQDTVFQIGSCSKPLTATLIARLVSDKTVQWDSRVKELWPGFETCDSTVTDQATLRDLLCHRTGIGKDEAALYYEMPITRDELLSRLPDIQQAAKFRSRWRYSGVMYTVAGRAAESVTRSPWEELMQRQLFQPLGMTRTIATSKRLSKMDNVAIPHVRTADGVRVGKFADQNAIAPAGAVCSSVKDLSKWLLMLTGQGQTDDKHTLIQQAGLRELTKPQISMPFSDPVLGEYAVKNYGLGFMVYDYHGRSLALHTGMSGHSMGIVGFVPNDRVGVAVLTNYRPSLLHYAVFRRAIDLFCGEDPVDLNSANRMLFDEHIGRQAESLKRRAATRDVNSLPTLPIQDYVGTYERESGHRATLSMEAKQLILRYGNFAADVETWNGDTLLARLREPRLPAEQNWYLTFTVEKDRVTQMHIESGHDVHADFSPVPKNNTTSSNPGVPK